MSTPRHLRNPALALLLTCSLLPGAATAAAQAAPRPDSVTSSAGLRGALRFWTAARMERARPLELSAPDLSAKVSRRGVARGPASLAERAAPRGVPSRATTSARTSSISLEAVPDPTGAAYRQNGAVFIVLGGFLARCSGTSVNAPNLSVVFTAGHCVNDGGPQGRWLNQEWVFVPGYHDGERPFGVFPAKWLGATRPWLATGTENSDVGAAVVSRNERGQRLAAAVGSDGIAWGLPPNQLFDVHGYPVAAPFDGAKQRLCSQTPFLGHDVTSFLWPGPLNLAVQCNVTGGASGGGWTIDGNTLNSVTDYGWGDDPTTDFGSYFGRAVGALYERAARVR